MGIERFGAEDERRADACFEIYRACRASDDPDGPPMERRVFAGWLKTGWVGDPRETWLLEDDGGIEGWYLLELPSRDNPHLGILDIAVRPDRRRRGFGAALLRHAGARAIANGRDVLTGNAFTGTAGEAFARAAGAAGGQTEVQRAMDIDAISAERLASLRSGAERASVGYSLVSWTGPAPEEYLDQVAVLNGAGYDAPHDPSVREPVWDAARVRATERRRRRQGVRGHAVTARHDASGELAGLTVIEIGQEYPEWGFQALTVVRRDHRGHRLGLRLKLAMLERLARQEPQMKRIVTSNGETNGHMISVNETLGYYLLGQPVRSWELPAARVKGIEGAAQS
jgi:GNAT superfamily N-acetyltransferase